MLQNFWSSISKPKLYKGKLLAAWIYVEQRNVTNADNVEAARQCSGDFKFVYKPAFSTIEPHIRINLGNFMELSIQNSTSSN